MPEIQIDTPAKNHGGGMAAGDPRWIVWHSVEAPAVDGLAKSLAQGYLQNPAPPVSVHSITDPGLTVTMVAENVQAWHAGPHANAHGLGNEQCGYARFTRDEWLAPKAFAVIRWTAKHAAEQGKRHGIPARWLSIAQIRAGEKGHCFHSDITLAFPGDTSHTDPGKGFPADKAMQMVQQWTAGQVVTGPDNPNPQPTGPVVGGAQGQDTNDMADITEAQMDRIAGKVVAQLLSGQAVFPVGDQVTTVAGALADLLRSRLAPKDVWTYGIPPGYDAQSLLYTAAGAPKPAEQPGK